MFNKIKTTWNKEVADEQRKKRDEEIRRLCDQLRAQGVTPNYQKIADDYGLTRERIRQIDTLDRRR